jgi:hypothetical protein
MQLKVFWNWKNLSIPSLLICPISIISHSIITYPIISHSIHWFIDVDNILLRFGLLPTTQLQCIAKHL